MDIGMVGLGRMGGNMAERLRRDGHRVVVFDLDSARVQAAATTGAEGAATLETLVKSLEAPRVIWVMIPAGEPTEKTLAALGELCAKGDVLIDGGNSNFKDSIRRARELSEKGVRFLDAGTSGGIWGLERGYCLMIGGDAAAFELATPAFRTLAPPDGFAHVGPSGAGHYVKMVHNGIEYGMLQSYAEGFELLHASELGLDERQIAALWNRGSVVRSWLLELAERALEKEGADLEALDDWVDDSGEGRWTVQTAVELAVPAPVITLSLMQRFRSRQERSYAGKFIAALRQQFGGHETKRVK